MPDSASVARKVHILLNVDERGLRREWDDNGNTTYFLGNEAIEEAVVFNLFFSKCLCLGNVRGDHGERKTQTMKLSAKGRSAVLVLRDI